ncbi:MAG: LPS-assembly protein LptD [Methylobacteriaceae bacterium]|nr:LPS-assembly protein LptD [Methylobacteriaceae bacterium]
MGRYQRPCQGIVQQLRRDALAVAGAGAAAALIALSVSATSAPAQSIANVLAGGSGAASGQKDKMLVEAKELIYNRDNDTVTASGDVQIYYQGKVLEADRVVYDRKAKRVYAEGNAKLTEPDGTVNFGSRFELSEDFRDGFIESLAAQTPDAARLTSPRAERTDADTTVFEKATYTACAPCAEHPERPPLWQIRAARIIHKKQEQTIYYEDATLELLGIPFAWIPFMSSPDSTVTRKSGLLFPHYVYKTYLGYGVGIPIYWAMAPNYDLTVTPTFLTQQGFLGDAEWRHRLAYGSYDIRAAGIFQDDPKAFPISPYGAGTRDFRGTIQSTGKFFLSDKWTFGWDTAFWSDKFFWHDYNITGDTLIADYFRESISTAYVNGQGGRGYFDLRGYYFEGLSAYDLQRQLPVVGPLLDYNKAFTLPKDRTAGIGGELTFDFNFTNLSRDLASYQSTGLRTFDSTFKLYDVCPNYTPSTKGGTCLLRGIGGQYDRVSADLSWRRNFIDPVGGLWQPFAFARVDGIWSELNKTNSDPAVVNSANPASPLSNSNQANWFGPSNDVSQTRVMPGIGLEYRFPLVASASWGSQVLEPIGQLVVRPDEKASTKTINEDAQSLIFDDTTLFEWNKFSGYDRVEGGTRLNAGAQYTVNFTSGAYANALVGQSFQLAGRNSYALGDDANTGLDSGLQNAQSYYITRVAYSPSTNYSFISKANFDNNNFALRRMDFLATMNFGHLNANIIYARYAAQPDIGFATGREGLGLSSRYNVTDHYYLNGSVAFDLTHYLLNTNIPTAPVTKTSGFAVAAYGFGVGYNDDCTTLSVNYSAGYDYANGFRTRNDTVLLQLTLRTLGTVKATQTISANAIPDGLVPQE